MRITIQQYEIVIALFMSAILPINWLIDGQLRTSISDYAYSTNYPWLLPLQLGIAGAMLVVNYTNNNKHWYNLILGLSLWGVAATPYKEHYLLHYSFASVFIITSILAIWLSSNVYFRTFKTVIALIASLGILIWVFFKPYTLAVAETLAIVPFACHFIVKSYSTHLRYIIKNFFK